MLKGTNKSLWRCARNLKSNHLWRCARFHAIDLKGFWKVPTIFVLSGYPAQTLYRPSSIVINLHLKYEAEKKQRKRQQSWNTSAVVLNVLHFVLLYVRSNTLDTSGIDVETHRHPQCRTRTWHNTDVKNTEIGVFEQSCKEKPFRYGRTGKERSWKPSLQHWLTRPAIRSRVGNTVNLFSKDHHHHHQQHYHHHHHHHRHHHHHLHRQQ